MTVPRSAVAKRTLDLFADAPRSDRLHIRGRWLSCPFAAVEVAVPRSGRILEVGCGHGSFAAFLALSSPARAVTGVDVDRDKIEVARRAALGLVPGEATLAFAPVEPEPIPDGPWDAIVIVDVLYLLGAAGRAAVLDRCAEVLAPGGVLVVKEVDVRPRWKHGLATAQELVATRVARITEGDHVDFAPPDVLAAELADRGFTVERRRIDRWYPHAHLLLLATRRAA